MIKNSLKIFQMLFVLFLFFVQPTYAQEIYPEGRFFITGDMPVGEVAAVYDGEYKLAANVSDPRTPSSQR